jgi:hypothetical protein
MHRQGYFITALARRLPNPRHEKCAELPQLEHDTMASGTRSRLASTVPTQKAQLVSGTA